MIENVNKQLLSNGAPSKNTKPSIFVKFCRGNSIKENEKKFPIHLSRSVKQGKQFLNF